MQSACFVWIAKRVIIHLTVLKNGKLISSKEDGKNHGWGLENVREIVERYDGILNIRYENRVFEAEVLIGGEKE